MLSDTEKAYVAGIVDGEGTLQIQTHRVKTKSRLGYLITGHVQIPNTDKKLIDWILLKYPNATSWHKNPRKKEHSESWVVVITKQRDIISFLDDVYPYLIIKKEHAEILKSFCVSRLSHRYGAYTSEEQEMQQYMKIINRKG